MVKNGLNKEIWNSNAKNKTLPQKQTKKKNEKESKVC